MPHILPPAALRHAERVSRRLRRNPVARALRHGFPQQIIPSGRRYRRNPKHRKGPFAPVSFGWA